MTNNPSTPTTVQKKESKRKLAQEDSSSSEEETLSRSPDRKRSKVDLAPDPAKPDDDRSAASAAAPQASTSTGPRKSRERIWREGAPAREQEEWRKVVERHNIARAAAAIFTAPTEEDKKKICGIRGLRDLTPPKPHHMQWPTFEEKPRREYFTKSGRWREDRRGGGNTVGDGTNTLGGFVSAVGRGLGETVEGATGKDEGDGGDSEDDDDGDEEDEDEE